MPNDPSTKYTVYPVYLLPPSDQCYFRKKIGRLASEEVILELVKNKIPRLLYGLECYALPKSVLRSSDFVVVRCLMKLFRTVNNGIIKVFTTSDLFCWKGGGLNFKLISCNVLVGCNILASRHSMLIGNV